MRRAAKTDANHNALRDAVRAAGLAWADTHRLGDGFPDAVIGGAMPCPHCGHDFPQSKLVEIKTPTGKLTPAELVWHTEWSVRGGQIAICRTVEEALRLAGRC